MRAQHTAIDGATVSITADLDLSSPFTSMGRIVAGYVVHELTVGPIGDVESLLASRSGGTTERFDYRDGVLQIASVEEVDPKTRARHLQVIAVWSIAGQAISGSFPGQAPDAVVSLLDTVDVRTAPGLAVVPRRSRWYDDPQLVKEIPGVGLLEVRPLTRERSAQLPEWEGARVQGGDLYRIDEREDAPALLLVSRSAASQILLDDPQAADTAATAASGISVEWRR